MTKQFLLGCLAVLGLFAFLYSFKLIYLKRDLQKQMDTFQKIVKSSADKDETSKQFYDNYFVKEVPNEFYIPKT